jgi:phage-related protein
MAFETFVPPVGVTFSPGTSEARKPRVLTAGFGDGYEQRTGDGINADLAELSVRFDILTPEEGSQILSFFQSKKGYIPFKYTLPGEATSQKWIAIEYDRVWEGASILAISATWREVADPEA